MVERNEFKAGWTLNDSFDPADLGMIAIETLSQEPLGDIRPEEIKVPKRKKPVDNTAAMDKWMEQQAARNSGLRATILVCIMLAIIAGMVFTMVHTADAGMAFLRFKVINISSDTITVRDEYGSVFDFYKEDSPKCAVGQEVIIATDLVYVGDSTWKMDRGRTSIISVED
jgi:hypothetical protein